MAPASHEVGAFLKGVSMLIKAVRPFQKRQVGEVFDVEGQTARDYIRNGLAVEVKNGKTPLNKMAAKPENKSIDAGKAPADGEVQQSSASQAAQALVPPTVLPSVDGVKRPILRLRAKRSR